MTFVTEKTEEWSSLDHEKAIFKSDLNYQGDLEKWYMQLTNDICHRKGDLGHWKIDFGHLKNNLNLWKSDVNRCKSNLGY